MSMLMKELKSEIIRLARKVAKQGLAPVRRVTAVQRGLIAELRRQVLLMEKDVARLRRAGAAAQSRGPASRPGPDEPGPDAPAAIAQEQPST